MMKSVYLCVHMYWFIAVAVVMTCQLLFLFLSYSFIQLVLRHLFIDKSLKLEVTYLQL